jgi:predicted DNA-binding transcriptional regulator AlpA
MSDTIAERFITIRELAPIVRLTPATIRKRARQGAFPKPVIAGTATRWLASDVQAWMRNPAAWQKKNQRAP